MGGSYNGLPDTLKICSDNTILDAGSGYNTYQWSTGAATQTISVSQTDLYRVKVSNASCSFSDSVFVKLQPVNTVNKKDTICAGQSYILPLGRTVNTTGIYSDTLKNRDGCDSVIFKIDLSVYSPLVISINKSICLGSSYVLPSGKRVDNSGTFKDTLRSSFNCDSIITILNLTVIKPIIINNDAFICKGQPYLLPSGTEVNIAGLYADTLKNSSGCDSVIRNTRLTIGDASSSSISVALCIGQSHTLPSGKVASIPGIYKDTLRNSVGCDSIITTTITKNTALTVLLNNPATVCSGDQVTMIATVSGGSGGPYNYSWSVAGSNTNQIVINPTATITVTVSVTDGCTISGASDAVTITVNPKPIPDFTIDVAEGCTPFVATFKNVTQPLSGNVFSWNFDDGFTSSENSPTHTYSTAGLYDVSLTVLNSNGCADSVKITRPIKTYSKPEADFLISPSPNITGNLKFQFTDMSIGGSSWAWDFGDNTGRSVMQNPSYNYNNAGSYRIALITTSGLNCMDTVYRYLDIKGYDDIYIPNAFTPNGDGKNDQFKIFGTGIQIAEMQIFNRWGEIVFKTTGNPPAWDGKNNKTQTLCIPGNYIYRVKIIQRNGVPKLYSGNILLLK